MKSRQYVSYKKKGFFALETLVATILSVIVLIMSFQIFVSLFLQTPTNEKVAEDNAQSIKDFFEYFTQPGNTYSSMTDCFQILKLTNLDNFQKLEKDQDENFFYVLSEERVFVLKYSDKQILLSEKENFEDRLNRLAIKKVELNQKINLKEDKTSSGSWVGKALTFGFFFNPTDIKLEDLENPFVILVPKNIEKEDNLNSNNMLVYNLEDSVGWERRGGEFDLGEFYPEIVFSRQFKSSNNVAFLPKSSYTHTLVQNNLCSKKILKEKIYEDEIVRTDLEEITYYNDKFDLVCYEEKSGNEEFKLQWNNGGSCKSETKVCQDVFGSDLGSLSGMKYRDLINLARDKCGGLKQGVFDLKVENPEQLQVSEMTNELDSYLDAFEKVEVSDLNKLSKEELVSIGAFKPTWIFGDKKINDCKLNQDQSWCTYVIVKDSKVFFYLKDFSGDKFDYYAIKSKALRKIKLEDDGEIIEKIYFLGTEITEDNIYDGYKVDAVGEGGGLFGGKDNQEIYILENVKIKDKNGVSRSLTLYLTSRQFNLIQEIKGVS